MAGYAAGGSGYRTDQRAVTMRALIRHFDTLVRRANGVLEFCDDEECLLRLQVARAPRTLHLEGQVVEAGEPVLILHLWNEHIPPLPQTGPDLAWAVRGYRMFIRSLCAVARQMQNDPRLAGVRAVGGVTVLFGPAGNSDKASLVQRLGFSVMPYHGPLGRFGEFWENFYSWWIMWTFNAASLQHRRLVHLRRVEIWMPVERFLNHYGAGQVKRGASELGPCPGEPRMRAESGQG
jgi:hypothetical protein